MTAFAALADLRDELDADQEDLANDLVSTVGVFNTEAITTPEIADEAERWLSARIVALIAVREDEMQFDPDERDHPWLGASKLVLKQANHLLHLVRLRLAEFRRAAHRAEHEERCRLLEVAFVNAAKDMLPDETYREIWARVNAQAAGSAAA